MFDYDPLDFITYDELNENEKENLKEYYRILEVISEALED